MKYLILEGKSGWARRVYARDLGAFMDEYAGYYLKRNIPFRVYESGLVLSENQVYQNGTDADFRGPWNADAFRWYVNGDGVGGIFEGVPLSDWYLWKCYQSVIEYLTMAGAAEIAAYKDNAFQFEWRVRGGETFTSMDEAKNAGADITGVVLGKFPYTGELVDFQITWNGKKVEWTHIRNLGEFLPGGYAYGKHPGEKWEI